MEEKKNIPEIRFKGFEGEWNPVSMAKIAVFSKGNGYSKSDLVETGEPIILYGRLYTKYQLTISDVDTFAIEKPGSIYSTGNEVIVPSSGETAEDIAIGSAVLKSGIILGGDLNIIYPKDTIDSLFLALSISYGKQHNELSRKAQGKSIVHLRNSDIKQTTFNYTDKTEQSQIGSFFQNLDKQITLEQQKYDKLVTLKKAMLEKMFPKEGEDVPEIRFKGFEGEWKKKRLGEITQITMGQSPSSINYTSNPKDHILVQGNSDIKYGRISPRVWTKQVTKTADPGDLIISVRAPVGDVGKTSYNIVIGRGVAAIKGNEFIFQFLKKMKEHGYWNRFSTGSTFESINSNNLHEAIISTISEKEQSKIGSYFQNLDKLISLQQQKIDKLKNIKKACLEKMFV